MDITNLLIQLVSGAIGGNVAGTAMKKSSLGTIGNSLVGILGGGLGAQILSTLGLGGLLAEGSAAGALNLEAIVSDIAGGGAGGAVLLAILGVIRKGIAAKA